MPMTKRVDRGGQPCRHPFVVGEVDGHHDSIDTRLQRQTAPRDAENPLQVDNPRRGGTSTRTVNLCALKNVGAFIAISAWIGTRSLTPHGGFTIRATFSRNTRGQDLNDNGYYPYRDRHNHQEDNHQWRIGKQYRFLRRNRKSSSLVGTVEYTDDPPCSLTAVVLDHELATLPQSEALFREALESVATHGPDNTCVILQTMSGCRDDDNSVAVSGKGPGTDTDGISDRADGDARAGADDAFQKMGDAIYSKAGPEFRRMITGGRVRLTLLDHEKYGLSCQDLSAAAIVNVTDDRYWLDEFHRGVDGDAVLLVQRDTFLCRPVHAAELHSHPKDVGRNAVLMSRRERFYGEESSWLLYADGGGGTRTGSSGGTGSFSSHPRMYPAGVTGSGASGVVDQGCGRGDTVIAGAAKRTAVYQLELPKILPPHDTSKKPSTNTCKPYSEWHKKSYPTCNVAHELDFSSGFLGGGREGETTSALNNHHKLQTEFVDQGHSRETWMIRRNPPFYEDVGVGVELGGEKQRLEDKNNRPLALKTFLWKKNYTELSYEYQRIDALASEVLASSPHINGIYGFCGHSVLNDFGDGGTLKSHIWDNSDSVSSQQRLVFARDAALGLADVHDAGGDHITTMVSHDVKLANMLIVNGKLKVHDFNNAHLLAWDFDLKKRCGFHFRRVCIDDFPREIEPPNECLTGDNNFSEKVEVFRLGLIFYFLLTEHQAGQPPPPHISEINGTAVLTNPPLLPKALNESMDPAIVALRRAMRSALTANVRSRPSARSLATFLARHVSEGL